MGNPTATIDILINSAEAGKQLGKFIEKFSSGMADISFGVAKMGGGIASALAGAFSIMNARDNIEKVRALSSMYGDAFDVSQIEQLGNEFRIIGGDANEAYNAIESIQGAIDDLRTEAKGPLFDLAKYMQLTIDDSTNALDILRQIANNYEQYGSDMFFRESLKKLGIVSKDMMYYLSQSSEEREKNAFLAQKNLRIDEETLQIQQRWRQVLGRLQTAFYTLGAYLLKLSKPVLEMVEGFAEWYSGLSDFGKGAVAGFGVIAGSLGVVFTMLKGIGALLGAGGIAAKVGGLLVIFGKWALIVAAIAAAMWAVYKAGSWLGDKIGEWWAKKSDSKELEAARERFKNSGWRPKASLFDIEDMQDNFGSLGWATRHNWQKGSKEQELQRNVLQGAMLNFNIQGVDTNNIPEMKRAIMDLIREQATNRRYGS